MASGIAEVEIPSEAPAGGDGMLDELPLLLFYSSGSEESEYSSYCSCGCEESDCGSCCGSCGGGCSGGCYWEDSCGCGRCGPRGGCPGGAGCNININCGGRDGAHRHGHGRRRSCSCHSGHGRTSKRRRKDKKTGKDEKKSDDAAAIERALKEKGLGRRGPGWEDLIYFIAKRRREERDAKKRIEDWIRVTEELERSPPRGRARVREQSRRRGEHEAAPPPAVRFAGVAEPARRPGGERLSDMVLHAGGGGERRRPRMGGHEA